MAFEKFKGLFGRSEGIKQSEDPLSTLTAEQRNTLNVLRDALQTKGNLTGEQIGALALVKFALSETVGKVTAEEVVAAYCKEVPTSRLDELKEIVSRQDFLKTTLMKSMAAVDKSATAETLTALERAKNALRVSSPETFTSSDVDKFCTELKESDEYDDFIMQRIVASPTMAPTTDQLRAPDSTQALPNRMSHRRVGEPKLDWEPPTFGDTLHDSPPPHLK